MFLRKAVKISFTFSFCFEITYFRFGLFFVSSVEIFEKDDLSFFLQFGQLHQGRGQLGGVPGIS
jgi:hypothetical protein